MSEEEYIVEKVLNKRKVDGVIEYLIKWEGYETEESTWEPIDNLKNIMNLIQDYENKEKKKQIIKSKPKEGI
jgi:hypothetical protein